MLAMSNVTGRPALVAPWGGAEPRMTTNPFCFARPFSDGRPPILVDFATSSMALNKARVMSSTGKQAAPGQLIDAQGIQAMIPGCYSAILRGRYCHLVSIKDLARTDD